MRICVLGRDFPPTLGGLADCTYWFCDVLAPMAEVHAVVESHDHVENGPNGSFTVHGFHAWGWRGTFRFLSLLRKLRPDVLIVNLQLYMYGWRGFCLYLVAWITLWKWLSRRILLMNYIELYAAPATWKHRPISWVQKGQARWLALRADHVVTADERNAKELSSWLDPARHSRVELIPVGGNIPPQPLDASARQSLIRAYTGDGARLVGTFSHLRHPAAVVEAWRILKRKGLDVRFLTIGDAGRLHTSDRSGLRAMAGEKGVGDLFSETGYLEPPEVSRHLQALEVYLYLDHCISTKSGTIMAALEHGLPVIAFHPRKEDGPFKHEENIFIVTDITGEALAQAVERVLIDETLREKLARNGKALYDRHFSWPVIGRRFMELLK